MKYIYTFVTVIIISAVIVLIDFIIISERAERRKIKQHNVIHTDTITVLTTHGDTVTIISKTNGILMISEKNNRLYKNIK